MPTYLPQARGGHCHPASGRPRQSESDSESGGSILRAVESCSSGCFGLQSIVGRRTRAAGREWGAAPHVRRLLSASTRSAASSRSSHGLVMIAERLLCSAEVVVQFEVPVLRLCALRRRAGNMGLVRRRQQAHGCQHRQDKLHVRGAQRAWCARALRAWPLCACLVPRPPDAPIWYVRRHGHARLVRGPVRD